MSKLMRFLQNDTFFKLVDLSINLKIVSNQFDVLNITRLFLRIGIDIITRMMTYDIAIFFEYAIFQENIRFHNVFIIKNLSHL